MLGRIQRLGTLAIIGLLGVLAASLLAATTVVLLVVRPELGPDVTLRPLVVPLTASFLVLGVATSVGAVALARRAVGTVENLFDHQDRVILAVAHEIRSPLSRAVAILDEAAGGLLAPDRAVDEARVAVDELSDLIDDLLQMARIMSGAVELPQEQVRLDVLVRRVAASIPPAGPRVHVDDEPVLLSGSPHLMRRAVVNLVRNAAEHGYGLGPGDIWVTVDQRGITIQDDGPGLSPARLEEVRYETPLAKRPATGGLGLLLAGWAAEAHQGRLVLRNRPEGGFEARIDLPSLSEPPRR